ncbi:MAG TPA: stage III sporulation protein AD [Firmicutes bacterium]|nr:stage III sporulation protein AD [Bacillota bacterium]
MDEMVRIVAIALVLTILLGFLRSAAHGAFAAQLGMGFMLLMLAVLLVPLRQVVAFFVDLGRQAEIKPAYTSLILRAIGIGYLASFGAQLARDAKEDTVANMVEMAGKVFILLLAAPVVAGILEALMGILP